MTKKDFLYLKGHILKNEKLDNEDIKYLKKAFELLTPCMFEDKGNTQETAIPINSVHNEYLAIKLSYFNYDIVRQYITYREDKYYDVITIRILEDKEIEIWFDINSFYPSAYMDLLDKDE